MSTLLRTEGMSHRCRDSQVRCSHCLYSHMPVSYTLRPCTKLIHNYWFPLKYVQSVRWIHLCYPEAGAFTKGEMVREEMVYLPLLCLEGSNTVFSHCLTCQSVGKTKQELVCVGILGKACPSLLKKACPSLLVRFTWKWSVTHRASKSTTWAQWGSIHTWLWATCSCIFWFTEYGRGGRLGLCNPRGRSLPWRWNVGTSLSLHYTACHEATAWGKHSPQRGEKAECSFPLGILRQWVCRGCLVSFLILPVCK